MRVVKRNAQRWLSHAVTSLLNATAPYYVVSRKTDPLFYEVLADFKQPFTRTLSRKFGIEQALKISRYFKRVATLPCEILLAENRRDLMGVRFANSPEI